MFHPSALGYNQFPVCGKFAGLVLAQSQVAQGDLSGALIGQTGDR